MRRHIRPEDIATSIMMARSRYPTKTVLIVEGDDDAALFEWHTRKDACRVEAAYGREKLKRVVAMLDERAFRGVLGVLDADFMMLEGQPCPSLSIILTDHHDVECMMLASPALDHLLRELGEPEKINAFVQARGCSVVNHLLHTASVIGHARWASVRNKWGLRFRGIDFEKFVALSTLALDRTDFIAVLRGFQGGRDDIDEEESGETVVIEGRPPPSVEEIEAAIADLEKQAASLLNVCCGHDVTAILSIGLRRTFGGRNGGEVKPARLEAMLRLAYDREYFRATALHASIRAWENANAPFVVL